MNITAIANQIKNDMIKAYPGINISVTANKHYDWIQVFALEIADSTAFKQISNYYSNLYNVTVTK